jgi:pyruvate/2-oxoglutarate dehydrogenase complex dihydrolipoamide dehydrogenase (E3) component
MTLPLCSSGLSEHEARPQGTASRAARLSIVFALRSRTTVATTFMKAFVEAQGDRILGLAMVGAEAGEVVAVAQAATLAGLPYTGLRDASYSPPIAEGLVALFSKITAPQ